jgi:hypothetical protein
MPWNNRTCPKCGAYTEYCACPKTVTADAPKASQRPEVGSTDGLDAGEQCLLEGKAQWERLPQAMRGMMDKATWDLAWQLAWCASMKASSAALKHGARSRARGQEHTALRRLGNKRKGLNATSS